MPPKKVKRGGPRENAGRKVDSTEKTDEIQRAYNHAVAILRGDV